MQFRHYRVPLLLAALTTLSLSSCRENDPEPQPRATASFTYTTGNCQTGGCPVTITNTSKNATKYNWDFGNSTTGTQADAQFTITYPQSGVYRVRLKAEGDGGSDEITQEITVGSGSSCTYSVVQVTSNISTPTTWEACKVYVVNNAIGLSSTLTIQPGAVVKLKTNAGITLTGGGIIDAVGSSAQPIVFTSFRDDAHAGDTNGDGATAPGRRDWYNVNLSTQNGSRFEFCKFLYAGGGSHASALELFGASATIKNCTFAHNGGNGTAPNFKGALDAGVATTGTIIQNNTFYDNEMPLRIINLFSLDNSNTFQNPQNPTQKNDYNSIWVEDTNNLSTTLSWGETEVPYVLGSSGWDAPLTLAPGVTLKFLSDANLLLSGNGRLLARGTSAQPIVFTSYLDDTYGGDTNHDGSATTPAKRNWRSIKINATNGSEFDYCTFMYGGGQGSLLDLFGGSASVLHSTFAHNGEDVTVVTRAALDAYNATAGTVIQHNTFYDNIRPLSITSSFDLDGTNVFHNPQNTSQKNLYQGVVVDWNVNKTKPNVSWGETEVAYVNIQNIDLKLGQTLNLADNVVMKFNSGVGITLRESTGQLTNATGTGVFFTSVKDDSRGGDSNGNGSVNAPSTGDWEGIYLDALPGQWMRWSNMQFNRR